jgi:hypothetical protein
MSDRRRIADDELFAHFVTFSCHERGATRVPLTHDYSLSWIDGESLQVRGPSSRRD